MKKNDRILRIIMSVVLVVAMLLLAKEAAGLRGQYVWQSHAKESMKIKSYRVVLDAGHGGKDPGKVGVTGCYEKEINLLIAKKVKDFLEAEEIEVFLVRDGDYGLYEETDSNKKNVDMRNRVNFIKEKNPDLAISIHQDSYSDSSIKGAQTFYGNANIESKELAQKIQGRLVNVLDKNNHRKAKQNDNYYLLKNTTCPMVIVESGFLSNDVECSLLETEYYQEKVAWAIYTGIMQYFNSK
jgi:N-acetylmuramoyl-L-alanine amidase